MIIYWKNHVNAYTGALKYWIPGSNVHPQRICVTSGAPPAGQPTMRRWEHVPGVKTCRLHPGFGRTG